MVHIAELLEYSLLKNTTELEKPGKKRCLRQWCVKGFDIKHRWCSFLGGICALWNHVVIGVNEKDTFKAANNYLKTVYSIKSLYGSCPAPHNCS